MSNLENKNWTLISLLRADLIRQSYLLDKENSLKNSGLGFWLGMGSPRFIPVLLYRLSHSLHINNFGVIAKILSLLNFFAFGIEIATRCPIGPGLFLPHTHGTVIGALKIGSNATIFQGVTLGAKEIDFSYSEKSRPILGDNVTIGSGAKVIGGIKIGNGVRVGANSVVLSDVPENHLAVGMPARYIKAEKV
jgi:serine O-acetyltransferase